MAASLQASRAMLDTIEASYCTKESESEWASDVLEKTLPWFHRGLFSVIGTYCKDSEGVPQLRTCVDTGVSFDIRSSIQGGTQQLDPTTRDAVYDGLAAYHLSEVWSRIPELQAVFAERIPLPARDLCQVTVQSRDGEGAFLSTGLPSVQRLSRGQRLRFSRVAAHITAAHRLRCALERMGEPNAASLNDHPLSEAIVSSEGKVLHAEGMATEGAALEELRRAALQVDRARSAKGRNEPDEALEAWNALVHGRWTIVENFDTDSRRYLVAMANPPELHESLALDPREAAVAELVAQGHSQKFVAYELGIHESDVSRALKSALIRMGLTRRSDLVALVRNLS